MLQDEILGGASISGAYDKQIYETAGRVRNSTGN